MSYHRLYTTRLVWYHNLRIYWHFIVNHWVIPRSTDDFNGYRHSCTYTRAYDNGLKISCNTCAKQLVEVKKRHQLECYITPG